MIRKVENSNPAAKNSEVLRFCEKKRAICCSHRQGAALLVVLLIVMTVTIVSLGFISRSDVELACGENMVLRAQMDYLAESALDHAKGLILNPQDLSSEYWQGGVSQQLYSGNDYYDVNVIRHDSCDGPTYRCSYDITCEAYRIRNGEKVGSSSLKGELRLDPCITLWTGKDMMVPASMRVDGDVYCNGTLVNVGVINGDVFANVLDGSISGQNKAVGDLSMKWPRVTVADFTLHYTNEIIVGSSLSGQVLGSCIPVHVCYRSGDLVLTGDVEVNGMLLVDGNLIVRGGGNVLTAGKNVPALLVTGNLIIEDGGALNVNGLVVVDGNVQISASSNDVCVLGGLFVAGSITRTTSDASGQSNHGTLCGAPIWQPSGGKAGGALRLDGVSDYVTVANSSSLQLTTALTIAAWIKGDAWGAGANVDAIARKGEVTPVNYQLAIADRRVSLMLDDVDGGGGFRGNTLLNAGQWYHVAATWDGSTVKVYVDGVLDNDQPALRGGTIGTDTRPLYIGGRAGQDLFDGIIDDVRIYNRALEAGDINDISHLVGEPSGLVGHWKLDEDGSSSSSVTAAPSRTALVVWSETGAAEKWGQASGAFFRSVKRE